MGGAWIHWKQSEMLVCKIAGCNKTFKSSKTLRRHALQKHSDNARFLVCNQPTVNGEMCHFETIHSGVLSYHRKHSLAHQRREDWHISCPFCQSKFARQHEMERHRRICKSRPQPSQASPNSNGSSVQSTVTGTLSEASLNHPTQLPDYMVPTRRNYDHQLFKMSGTKFNIESGITLWYITSEISSDDLQARLAPTLYSLYHHPQAETSRSCRLLSALLKREKSAPIVLHMAGL